MVTYMAELLVFRNNAWCLKSFCYRASTVISEFCCLWHQRSSVAGVGSAKVWLKHFVSLCWIQMWPISLVCQDPMFHGPIHSSTEEMQTEPSWPYWITSEVSLSSRCLILTISIYLQLQWLEQAPLVWLGKVWEGQREYCPVTAIKISVRCAGTQPHCRVCSHEATQQHLLFAGHVLIQRSWVSGKSEPQCQVTKNFSNKCATSTFSLTILPCKPVSWDLLLLICYCK